MLKINFADFWPNFPKTDNYFYHLLSTKYDVVIDEDDPDLLFFSVDYSKKEERSKYSDHRCKKIFFTGENVSPHFDGEQSVQYPQYSIGKADVAFSFQYSDDPRNYRFPLWAFFMNWFDRKYDSSRDPAYLIPIDNVCHPGESSLTKASRKKRFCNFLFTNTSGERIKILDTLEKYKRVDCAGRLRNNTWRRVKGRGDQIGKINFLSQFKFTIAAENTKSDGYTTEKMIHPMSALSIPIYWGSDRVTEEFNEQSFINANKLSGQDLLDRVIEIDQNDDLYRKMIAEPVFPDNKIPESVLPENVLKFLDRTVLC